MEAPKSRHITIMIMPETSSDEVRRLRIHRGWLRLLLGGVAAVLCLALGFGIYGSLGHRTSEAHRQVLQENAALRDELLDFDQRLSRAQEVVLRLQSYEEKLRSLTMVSDPARNLAIGPVGPARTSAPAETVTAAHLRRALLSSGTVEESVELMKARVEHLEVEGERAEIGVATLSTYLEGQRATLASTPSRRPGPGYVSSTFGMRVDPFTGLPQFHAGIDFAANMGAPVVATADGVVIMAGEFGAFGNTVQVDHGHGLTTVYSHMARVDVAPGDTVRRGDRVGAVGNTGRSTGPHLHYEVRLNGIPQDPSRFILD